MSVKSTKVINKDKQTLKILSSDRAVIFIIESRYYKNIPLIKRIRQAFNIVLNKRYEGIILTTKEEAKSLGSYLLKL